MNWKQRMLKSNVIEPGDLVGCKGDYDDAYYYALVHKITNGRVICYRYDKEVDAIRSTPRDGGSRDRLEKYTLIRKGYEL